MVPASSYQPPPTTVPDTSCDPRRSASAPDPARAPADQVNDQGTQVTLASIKERGFLRVGIDQDTLLFGFRDPTTGRREGVDIDMARAISREIFGDAREPVFRVVPNAARQQVVQDREVDMVIQTMTITCERKHDVAFSSVYFEAGQRVLVREADAEPSSPNRMVTSRDLAGRTVCTTPGSDSGDNVYRLGLTPPPRVVAAAQWNDCLVLLQHHVVDAVATDHTILDGMHADDPRTAILGGDDVHEEPYGIAMNLADTDLVRAVNRALEDIRTNGTWASIYATYLPAGTYGPIPPPPTAEYCQPGAATC